MGNALGVTVHKATLDARKSAKDFLDEPRKSTINNIRPFPRRGSGANVRPGFIHRNKVLAGKAEAFVEVNKPLVEELHPIVYGGRVRQVPEGAGFVMQPTRKLLRLGTRRLSRQSQGALGAHLTKNKFGNIARLRQGAVRDAIRDTRNFLHIPIKDAPLKIGNRSLPAGLYLRIWETYEYKQGPRRGRVNGAGAKLVPTRLVQLLIYKDSHVYKRQWPYNVVVVNSYEENFEPCFARELTKELRFQARRNRLR